MMMITDILDYLGYVKAKRSIMIQLFEKNNMKKYILIIIFIFIHFASCQQNEIDPKEYFLQVVNIKANQINADTYKLSSFGG